MPEIDHSDIPQVYALTALTREAGGTRRVVVLGFDAPLRGVVIAIVALAIAAAPTFIAWLLVGPAALTVTALVVAAVFYLVEHRTRSGLQLRTYQAMADRRNERIGQFICCGRRVYPNRTGFGMIRSSSMPSPYLVSPQDAVDRLFWVTPPDPPAKPSTDLADAGAPGETAVSRSRRRPPGGRRSDPFAELARSTARTAGRTPVDEVV